MSMNLQKGRVRRKQRKLLKRSVPLREDLKLSTGKIGNKSKTTTQPGEAPEIIINYIVLSL